MDFSLFCLYLQMMFKSIFIWGTIGVCCTLFAPSCKDQERGHAIDLPVDKFHEGDIVFRRGMGLTSQIVLAADSKGTYSHIGILKQIDNNWYVIHAVPGEPDYKGDADRVKIDDLYRFFAPDRASRGAVMRVDGESQAAQRAAQHALALFEAGVLFDHDYNLTDTTQMYCTELVNYVYQKEGIDLSEGRLSHINIPGLGGTYLLPNDIAQNQKLQIIYSF